MTYYHTLKITDSMDKMLTAVKEDWPKATIQSLWEDALINKFILHQFHTPDEKKDYFKPCPMCGFRLSIHNTFFYDDDGNFYDHVSDQFVEHVGIACECGYQYTTEIENVYDEEEDLYEGGKWEENFTALANRRYKVVD